MRRLGPIVLLFFAVVVCGACQPIPGPVLVRDVGISGDEVVVGIADDSGYRGVRYAVSRDGLTWTAAEERPDLKAALADRTSECVDDPRTECFTGHGEAIERNRGGQVPQEIWRLPPGRHRWASTKHDGVVKTQGGLLGQDPDPFAPEIEDVAVQRRPAGLLVVAAAGSEGVVVGTADGTWHRVPVLEFRPTPLSGRGVDGLTWEAFAGSLALVALAVSGLLVVVVTSGTLRFRWPTWWVAAAGGAAVLVALAVQLPWLRWVDGSIARHGDAGQASVLAFLTGGALALAALTAGGWRFGTPRSTVRLLCPPVGWRVLRAVDRRLLPERFDSWQHERARSARLFWRTGTALTGLAVPAGVASSVAARARLRGGGLTIVLVVSAAVVGLLVVVWLSQDRVTRAFDHPIGEPRTGTGGRRHAVAVIPIRFVIVVVALAAVIVPAPSRALVRAVRDGPACRGVDPEVARMLRSVLMGPVTLRDVSAVTAGGSTAIAFDALRSNGFTNGVVVVIHPPNDFANGADLVLLGTYGVPFDGLRAGVATRDDSYDVTWHGPYEDPIAPAVACHEDAFAGGVRELEIR